MSREASSFENQHKSRQQTDPAQPGGERASRILLRLVDAGLLGVIFVAPLFMGGRGDIGRLVYVALACGTAVGWLVRQSLLADARWRWSGLEWVLLAGVLLVVLQLAPLPPGVLRTLSPQVPALLPLWTTQAAPETQLGVWNELTLSPQATRGGLITFLAHAMLFLVLVQRIRDVQDVQRLVRWLALAAIGMAVLGLAQLLFGNGKFLWIYEHPSRDTVGVVKGSFQNQNHFAHFLALGIGPLLWWLQRLWAAPKHSFGVGSRSLDQREILKHALTIGLGLVVFAGLLTFSRGGVLAMFAATVIGLGVLIRRGLLGKKSLAAVGGLAVVMAGALMIFGYEPLATRLSTLRDSRSLNELSRGRNALWAAHLKAIPQFAWAGVGVGSHPYIYPTYLEEDFDVEFTHGENGYLHLLVETGIPGLVLMLAAAAMIFCWCLRVAQSPSGSEGAALAAALVPGLAASLLHSFGDFVWYIPACLSLTIVLAACACRMCQLTPGHQLDSCSPLRMGWRERLRRCVLGGGETAGPRIAWIAASAGLVGLATVLIVARLPAALAAPHWDAYFKLAREARDTGPVEAPTQSADRLSAMAAHLAETLRCDPHHPRANLRMAAMYLRQFDAQQQTSENPMPLNQIRDAALASQFPTRQAQDQWLAIVTGENRRLLDRALVHAQRALRLCPLQGEGYVYLAELAFLNSASPQLKHAFVDQGLRVRPHSGVVLLAAGGEAALVNDNERALRLWKQAFHADREQQIQIINTLALKMPADAFLDHFRPDRVALKALFCFYHDHALVEPAKFVGSRCVEELERDASQAATLEAAALWDQASGIHAYLGDPKKAADCARQAVFQTPDDFMLRRRLVESLLNNQEYSEAISQLQWCLGRRPDDPGLQQQLEQANRQRLASQTVIARQ
ncbi:MAG: O-antigen ligase family protein [Pirellulaceae bacterium]|nr:O-antigen ligase family protein [Pirellulaceae bacterium]